MSSTENHEKHNQELSQRSGNVFTVTDPLVDFLYTLMRDEVPAGIVERIVREALDAADTGSVKFTNGWLAHYADDLAKRLRGEIK